jgi:hypothetical protein
MNVWRWGLVPASHIASLLQIFRARGRGRLLTQTRTQTLVQQLSSQQLNLLDEVFRCWVEVTTLPPYSIQSPSHIHISLMASRAPSHFCHQCSKQHNREVKPGHWHERQTRYASPYAWGLTHLMGIVTWLIQWGVLQYYTAIISVHNK